MEETAWSRQFVRQVAYLAFGAILFGFVLSAVLTYAATGNDSPGQQDQLSWAAPSATTLQRVSQTTSTQAEPVLLNNLDCTTLTYRMVATTAMRSGCFTDTAFGLLNTDDSVVIFGGADEGLPVKPYTPQQILVPWPNALNLVGLDPVSTGGTLISLYNNPLAALQDQRDILGKLTAKQLNKPPDTTLKDSAGKPLVINPQTVAFSENGAWLVVETLGGTFVRINLATLGTTAFAHAYGSSGSPALLKSRVAITEDGRFVAIANDIAEQFKVYDLKTCGGTANSGLQPQNCQAHDYWPFVRQQTGGLQSLRHVRFVNEGLLMFDVIASDPAKSGKYELAPAGAITALTDYIALGDSYTSGEGAFNYLSGTDTEDNLCHLSRNSYPLLIAQKLFGSNGGHSAACSGAVIKDVVSLSNAYRGQVRDGDSLDRLRQNRPELLETVEANFIPGYVAQQRFIQRWQPRIITLGIGGNDIGFGHIVQNCVAPHLSVKPGGNTCYRTYEDRLELLQLIDRTVPRWTAAYKQLRGQAPHAKLYAIGYPQVAVVNGSCALNVHLDRDELQLATDIVDYLNLSIRKAAMAAGVAYVDISQALAGHRLCEAASYNVAVNGLTAGTDAGILSTGPIGKESYHPNALGHQLIAQAILKQTSNFIQTQDPPASTTDSAPGLLSAPVTGRVIRTLVPAELSPGTGKRGAAVPIQLEGGSIGLRAVTDYTVRLDGPSGEILGTVTSNQEGALHGSITIPLSASPGAHTLEVTGPNQLDNPLGITQPFYILASDIDADGDGIETILDSCPMAADSRQDDDGDGVDDACDGMIGLPPGPMQPANRDTADMRGEVHVVSSGSKPAGHVLGAAVKASGRPAATPQHAARGGPKRAAPKARPGQKTWLALIFVVPAAFVAKKYIQKIKYRLQWLYMSRARKGFIYLLSLCLLATLIGTAISASTNNTLGKPQKVEQALHDSKIYEHFITYTSDQAKKTNGDTDQTDSVSLSDAAVKAAAESAFPPQLIEKSVNTFIESNYAWLEGKTAKPEFVIDLSAQKLTFAQKVGAYVTTYTAGLPVCADDQIAAQQSQDPLAATCRPASVAPETVGAQVTQKLATTGDFLGNSVITPTNINPDNNQQSEPYYEKLQHLPKAYRFSQKLPYILAGLSALLAVAIVFISPERRKGLRKVGVVLLIAGLSLVALKFFADLAFRRVENRVFNDATTGQLQQSLTDFAHRIEESLVRTDLWFGIGFLVLAAVIFIALTATRQKDGGSDKPATPAASDDEDPDAPSPIVLSRKRLTPRPNGPKLGGAPPKPETPAPKPKKPRRLVQ